MPPRAMRSSVIRTISRGATGPTCRRSPCARSRRCWSSRKTRLTGSGNLGRREFAGLKPKPPNSGSNCSASCVSRLGGHDRARAARLGRSRAAVSCLRTASVSVVGRLVDLGPLVSPGVGHRADQGQEPGEPVAAWGEIRPAEERAAVGRQEHRHRPAAAAEGLEGRHVDLVDVGPLLAIDLDADEVRVEMPWRSRDLRSSRAP